MSFSTLFYPFSPRLDDIGNSVRGVQFCKLIAKHFSFHAFAPLTEDNISNEQEEEYLTKAIQQKLQKQQSDDQTQETRGNNTTLKKEHKEDRGPERSTTISSRITSSTNPTTTSIPPSSPLHSPVHSPMHHARPRASSPLNHTDRRWDPRRHDERKNTEHQTEEENVLEMLWAAYVSAATETSRVAVVSDGFFCSVLRLSTVSVDRYDNDIDTIRQLISRGVNVNVCDYDGRR